MVFTEKEVLEFLRTRQTDQRTPDSEPLTSALEFLLPPSAVPPPSSRHWYCKETPSPVHKELATYFIYFFAFNRTNIAARWMEALEELVARCEGCARGFCRARGRFVVKYINKFPPETRNNFQAAVDQWQIAQILPSLYPISESPSSPLCTNVLTIPAPQRQLLFGKENIPLSSSLLPYFISAFSDPSSTGGTTRPNWSLGTLPGLFPLFLAKEELIPSPEIRELIQKWVFNVFKICKSSPLSMEEWTDLGFPVLWTSLMNPIKSGLMERTKEWELVLKVLESGVLGREVVEKSLVRGKEGLVKIVSAGLGGRNQAFPLSLRTFAATLRTCPRAVLWTSTDDSLEFPLALLSTIQQNPIYLETLQIALDSGYRSENQKLVETIKEISSWEPSSAAPNGVGNSDWVFSWMTDYLISVRDLDVKGINAVNEKGLFGESLPRVIGFCLEVLQHRRFSAGFRAKVLDAGIKIVNSVYIDLGPNRSRVDMLLRSAMRNALDIHAGVITGIALNHKEYPSGPIWDPARRTAIDFLFKVLMADGDNVRRFLTNMGRQALDARQRKGPDPNDFFPKMTFAEHVWKKIYATAGSRDIHGIVMLIRGIMRFAHLPTPRGNAWGHTGLEFWKSEGKWAASMVSVTSAMKVMKEGFGDKLTTFVAASDPRNLKGLFDTPRVPEAVIRLLLCSDADVHDTIIGLIQGIFDEVEERVDCFRAMFLHFPAQSISALQDYLNKWVEDALSLPTAVDSARWLVRCFTDILEVLCRQSGAGSGLAFLRDPAFLEIKTASGSMKDDISALWDCMTKALAVIIKRTPKWAPFYENAEMVDWMQDALIFGRLLVEENRTFEGAALGTAVSYRESPAIEVPSQATDVGSKMIRQLEQVLDSLTSWLRLTEVETLHQTYELIKSLLDRLTKTHVNQSPSASLMVSFTTVDGYCRRQKGHKSKLNDSELAELADLIRPYIKVEEVLDDEVEYVSTSAGRSSNLTKEALATPSQQRKNAFQELMKNAQKGATPRSKADRDASSNQVTPRTSPDIIDVDDFDDDEFDDMLAGVDLAEIDAIERSAVNKETQRKLLQSQALKTGNLNKRIGLPPGKPPAPKIPPKPAAPVIRGSGLLSRIRREVAAENRDNKVPVIKKIDRGLVLPKIDLNSREKTPSESSASSDSENEGGGLAALKRLQKISPKKLTVMANKPRVVAACRPELSAAERQRLNAQRTKLRLKPDMTGLWSTMLKWDPQQHDFEDKLPNRLPGKFKTVEEHVRTYLPLFYRELRDQSLNELKEATNPVILTIEIGSRQHTDDFIDMELSIVGNIPFGWYANEYDVCLLQFDGRTIFVKVQAFKRSPRNTTLHVRMDSTKDSMGLAVKSRCQLRKHMNMSTAAREYAALKGLPYYEPELLQSILDAKPTALPEIPQVTWEKAMIAYNVNEPQAKAIIGSMRIKGFALIQGPPGTGKTKTISGLAGRFMTERPTHISLQGSEKTVNAKLLICAPSNAAIDEVTRRLKDGVPTSDGKMVVPRIVRLGAESSMNAAVTDVSLDSLIEARVSSVKAKGGDNDIQMKRVELALEEIKQKREAKQAELSHVGNDDEKRRTIEAELAGLVQQRILKSKEINKFRDAARDSGRQLDGARREARERILQDADIICSTLAGAGHDSIASFQFETVIIDEAAQSVEPSALVPLKYGCTRCILVGDPQQLPPTVISTKAESIGYNRSLFVRMVEGHPEAMHLLSIQYRMNPDISRLPSQVFYGGRLHDGPNMAQKTKAPWHQMPVFGTYRFFNANGREVKSGRQSLKNPTEVNAVVGLYRGLKAIYGAHDALLGKIGIISPYREQFNALKSAFRSSFGESAFDDIDFGTIDGFQGQEKDIIILSTVRSGDHLNSIGFLKDVRRMNVALTRAKSSLFIIGNADTLERANDKWRIIVENARERNFLVPYEPGIFMNPARAVGPPPEQTPNQQGRNIPKLPAAVEDQKWQVKPPKADLDSAMLVDKKEEKKRKRPIASSESSGSRESSAPVGSAEHPKLDATSATKKKRKENKRLLKLQEGQGATKMEVKEPVIKPNTPVIPPLPRSAPPPPPPRPPPPKPKAQTKDTLFIKKKKSKYT